MKKIKLNDLPLIPTTHDQQILKQTIIKNGEIPRLTTFGRSGLNPGDRATEHIHPTMYEVFHILNGTATFHVNGEKIELNPNDTFVIEPGEKHYQENISQNRVDWIYFGVEV